MIIFISVLLTLYEVQSSTGGICSEYDSSGNEIWFCCNNHEAINSTCIECVNGYESLDGSPCRPCPKGFFGKECLKMCDCNTTKCNHITGCINIERNWTGEKEESTNPLTNTPSLRGYTDNSTTTFLSLTMKLDTISGKTSTALISTRKSITTDSYPKKNNIGLNNREIIIYSIGASIFAFFILMCIVCVNRYKQIYGHFKRYQTVNRQRINVTENPPLAIPLEDIEEVYEEIDESNMIDNVETFRDDNMSESDTYGSYVQPDSNGYLTPFQPADKDANTNISNDSKSESSASNNQPISDDESTSSKSDVIGERSSYLNPYQPIIHSADIHEYSFSHKIDDSGSSGSDTQELESGYLNPYQPIVPDDDLHDYKSVLKCSDESDSTMSNVCTNDIGDVFSPSNQDQKSETETY